MKNTQKAAITVLPAKWAVKVTRSNFNTVKKYWEKIKKSKDYSFSDINDTDDNMYLTNFDPDEDGSFITFPSGSEIPEGSTKLSYPEFMALVYNPFRNNQLDDIPTTFPVKMLVWDSNEADAEEVTVVAYAPSLLEPYICVDPSWDSEFKLRESVSLSNYEHGKFVPAIPKFTRAEIAAKLGVAEFELVD